MNEVTEEVAIWKFNHIMPKVIKEANSAPRDGLTPVAQDTMRERSDKSITDPKTSGTESYVRPLNIHVDSGKTEQPRETNNFVIGGWQEIPGLMPQVLSSIQPNKKRSNVYDLLSG